MNSSFKKFYNGFPSEFVEYEYLFKTLKRQITSYLKESSLERFHGIFNKVFLLRKCLPKEEFYNVLLEGMNNEEKETFMTFILTEGFEERQGLIIKEEIEDIWEHQLKVILMKYRKRQKI